MKAKPTMKTKMISICVGALALLVVLAPRGFAQSGAPLWTNRYNGSGTVGDKARALAVDGSGNVFVTGFSYGGASSNDFVTIKYSNAGVPLWTNLYNGAGNSSDAAGALAVDGSGNVFVTGYSIGSGGLPDYVTIKYSDAGVSLWTNRYNESGNGYHYNIAEALAVDGSGNVFVTGYSANASSYDYATIKYSSAGTPLWTNRYNGPVGSDDYALAVAVDGGGNVFVTGYSTGSGSSYDYATIKYSNAGVPLWTNRYNGSGNSRDIANALAVDGSGNVFVTGYAISSGSSNDYVTIAYSSAGVPLWTNIYNGPGNNSDGAYALAVDSSGNVFVTGNSIGSGSGDDYATIKYSRLTPPQQFTASNSASGLQLSLVGTPNYPYVLQTASNMVPPVVWQSIFTNPADANGDWNFTDTNVSDAQRFYRATVP